MNSSQVGQSLLRQPPVAPEAAHVGRHQGTALHRHAGGASKPVYQGKELVGYVQEYSDTLLIFLMKGAMPETYRERVEQTSTVRHEPTVDLTKLTDAELTQWAALAEKAMPGPARAALPAPKEGNNILD